MSDDKRCLIHTKNATQQKRSREKWDNKKKEQENASAKLRMQKMRAQRKEVGGSQKRCTREGDRVRVCITHLLSIIFFNVGDFHVSVAINLKY